MSEQEISGKWKKRFDLIDKAGGVKLPLVKNLSLSERVTAAFNIWGFIFGVFYYVHLGMSKKGLFLFGIITLGCVLTALLESVFPEIKLLQYLNASTYFIMPLVFGGWVNIDYYKKIFVKEKSDENKLAYIGIASIIATIAIVSFIDFKGSDPLDDLSGVWKGDTDQATVVISLKSDNKSIEINGKVIPVKVMEWDSRSDILSLIVNNNTSVVWALRKISSKDGSFTLKLTTNDGHEDTLSFVRNINKVVQAPPTEAKRTDAKPETKGESNGVREGVTSKNDNNKPLENWNIKTSHYNLILQHMKESASYADVLPPNCSDISDKGLQLICAREDFKNIAWAIRRLNIYAEENATKRRLDHKTAYSGVYKVDCNDQDCLGKFLQQSFYGAIEEAGMSYLLAQPATATAPQDSLSINNRWLGVWRSGSAEKLTISETKFGDCQWVKNETAAQKKCLAYYKGKITKKELATDINKDLNSLTGWLQQKVISAADYQKMKAVSESYKKILDEISDDTFRTIFVDYGEVGSPDAFTVYFLDKDYVYQTAHVVGPIAPAFSITKYRKQ